MTLQDSSHLHKSWFGLYKTLLVDIHNVIIFPNPTLTLKDPYPYPYPHSYPYSYPSEQKVQSNASQAS
jgi:hypothetical protein